MYPFVLGTHNVVRWLVLAAALYAIVRALRGWFGKAPWTEADATAGKLFAHAMNLQLVLGLLLYAWLSPVTREAFRDFGGAMRDATLRYFAVEHLLVMLIALALVHIGAARSRRATPDVAKHRTAGLFFTIALVLMLSRIPWDRGAMP